MNCWTTLGIDPGADRKAIKLAYAKHLKKTRPDDNPEGFLVLNQAYKAALAAESSGRQAAPASEPEPLAAGKPADSEPASVAKSIAQPSPHAVPMTTSTVSFPGETPDEDELSDSASRVSSVGIGTVDDKDNTVLPLHPDDQEKLNSDKQFIKAHAHQLLESPERVNRVEEWKYIESVDSMIDLNFRTEVRDLLFALVSRANYSTPREKRPCIETPVLKYLNDYFQWDRHWKHYEALHGHEQSQAVLLFINEAEPPARKREAHLARRLAAFSIDLMIVIAFIILSQMVPGAELVSSAGMIYLVFGIPTLEASRWQASIGKRILGLKIIGNGGQRASWYRMFFRNLLMLLSLGLIQLSALPSAYFYFSSRVLLHDKLTDSYVVKT